MKLILLMILIVLALHYLRTTSTTSRITRWLSTNLICWTRSCLAGENCGGEQKGDQVDIKQSEGGQDEDEAVDDQTPQPGGAGHQQ